MGEEYDFFADPRNDAFAYNDLGSSPSNSQILSDINYSPSMLSSLGSLLSGGSGSMAQIASLGGIGALLNSIGGGSGGGGFKGYQGSIPKYTASRTQYAPPVSTASRGPAPSNEEILEYLKRPGLNDSMIARSMNEYGVSPQQIADVTKSPLADIQSRYQAAMGPNAGIARRPGSGGVTYFSPMVYTPQAAAPAALGPRFAHALVARLCVQHRASVPMPPQDRLCGILGTCVETRSRITRGPCEHTHLSPPLHPRSRCHRQTGRGWCTCGRVFSEICWSGWEDGEVVVG
jgi:hypothetical protein